VTSCVNCAIAHCKSCDINQCYKCFNNFYGTLSASNIIVSCTPTCPDYYYTDSSTGLCVKCIDLCMTCTSSNNCQKCVTPYFLYTNNCLNSCPEQTYSITNVTGGFKCQDCGALC
jgi:proprotein convertase subtilisin/kexin type 5